MEKFKLNRIFCLAILNMLISCAHKQTDRKEVETQRLTSEVFITDESLDAPAQLCALSDGLAISNEFTTDTLISIYDRNGNLVNRLLPKGEGDKEALWIPSLQYDQKEDVLYAPDLKKLALFKISGYRGDQPTVSKFFSMAEDSWQAADSVILGGQIVRLFDGTLLASNSTPKGMWVLSTQSGDIKEFQIPYPDKEKIDKNLSDMANIMLYYPFTGISPDGKFFMATYSKADMRVSGVYDEGKWNFKSGIDAYPNGLMLIETAPGMMQAAITGDTYIYSLDVAVSNDNAYVLYKGKPSKDIDEEDFTKDTKKFGGEIIKRYDKSGVLTDIFELDYPVRALAVSPDDKYLYGLTESSEDGYTVLRYEIH